MDNLEYAVEFETSQTTEQFIQDAINWKPSEDPEFAEEKPFLLTLGNRRAIRRSTGEVIGLVGDTPTRLGVDHNWLKVQGRYQEALQYKENTAFKLVERTSKADVYFMVAMRLGFILKKSSPENLAENIREFLEHLNLKFKGHQEYLSTQPIQYEFATQNFTPRVSVEEKSRMAEGIMPDAEERN